MAVGLSHQSSGMFPRKARVVTEFACKILLCMLTLGVFLTSQVAAQTPYPGIGRAATAKELRAWDIDVRPDFKGLPPGSGSVAKGQDLWEAKCASCHGVFGESNEVFTPLVGGTTKDDVRKGLVARLTDESFPSRTTLMKVSSLSTLWDYIYRAMPWTQPKSLSADEVYALTAFMLNLGGIVPDNYVLSNHNMPQTQAMMPNRHGMTHGHSMWPGTLKGAKPKPDLRGSACMANCKPEANIASFLPDFARDAHGNLAEQNRLVGPQRGAVTSTPGALEVERDKVQNSSANNAANNAANYASNNASNATTSTVLARTEKTVPAPPSSEQIALIINKQGCLACHGMSTKLLGPSFQEVTKKYEGRSDAPGYLASRIKSGGSGVWGSIPMPAQSLSESEAKSIAQWLSGIAAPGKGKP